MGTLALGVVSLFLEQVRPQPTWLFTAVQIIDFLVLTLTLIEVSVAFASAPIKRNYLRYNVPSLAFL
ncbi:MAG: hypothetical protein GVY29_09065, partial [Spirochaetes bacterium]|nr:hypothetical protein [Spirochaetota bacterium]